jgi:organic hydroperoxide reductase OsmC/OhrA
MSETHRYELSLHWTGTRGSGTSGYRAYSRDHELTAEGKPTIAASSDPAFRGDPARWNPEELLVASLAQCHLLWYLHLAGAAGMVITDYRDDPVGVMRTDATGAGQFERVTLRPVVTVAEAAMQARAQQIHAEVGAYCFIARSVNFPVEHEPTTVVTAADHAG